MNQPLETVNSHLIKMRDLAQQLGEELIAMQKLEQTLKASIERLERGSNLVHLEAQHVEAIIKRAVERVERKPAALTAVPAAGTILDKVEAELTQLIGDKKEVVK